MGGKKVCPQNWPTQEMEVCHFPGDEGVSQCRPWAHRSRAGGKSTGTKRRERIQEEEIAPVPEIARSRKKASTSPFEPSRTLNGENASKDIGEKARGRMAFEKARREDSFPVTYHGGDEGSRVRTKKGAGSTRKVEGRKGRPKLSRGDERCRTAAKEDKGGFAASPQPDYLTGQEHELPGGERSNPQNLS